MSPEPGAFLQKLMESINSSSASGGNFLELANTVSNKFTRLVPAVFILKNKDRVVLVHHSRDLIGYVVLKI